MEFLSLLSNTFIQRALLVGVLVALCAALLGVVLVLKRYSLIGHGLADVGFASLSLALALGLPPLLVSAPVVVAASFVIMAVSQKKGTSGDVAIGIAATASLSFGVIVTALTKGFNTDVYSYMFGSILAVGDIDILMSAVLAALVVGLFVLFYNRLFIITCDEAFAKASGINITLYQFLIAFLTALTVVVGMRIMGTLLISSLVIFPAVTARKVARSFRSLVVISAIVSVFCLVAGIFTSYYLDLPAGASIVAVNIAVMLVTGAVSKAAKMIG